MSDQVINANFYQKSHDWEFECHWEKYWCGKVGKQDLTFWNNSVKASTFEHMAVQKMAQCLSFEYDITHQHKKAHFSLSLVAGFLQTDLGSDRTNVV